MHILFLLTQDLESPAGVGRYYPWARGLNRLGHRVSISALHANFASLSQTRFEQDGVDVHYVAQMHVLKQNHQKIYFPPNQLLGLAARATWALLQDALAIPADIIHIGKPHPMNSIAGLVTKYMRGRPVFLDCDDFEVANSHFSGRWQKWGVAFFENNVPLRVDHVTTHTYFLRNYLLGLGVLPERITYIPHGVDFERFAHVDPARVENLRAELGLEGNKVVAFVGSLSLPSHPVDLLLEAFQCVRETQPKTMLLVVGGGEEYERLVGKTRDMGLGGAVRFCGRIPGSEVPNYYRLADVLVEPVFDNPVGRSSLPLKLFESWVSGVPFVTADVGDRRMVLGDPPAGLLARPGDSASLADVILQILNDPELAQVLCERGMERAQCYSWDRLAKRMEQVYLSAIQTRQNTQKT